MTDNQKKLMNILREMFQFDQSDLDFGIYRIMRMKRDEVDRFIEEELPAQITEGLRELSELDIAAEVAAIDKQIADTKAAPLSEAIKTAAIAELEEKKKSLAARNDITAVEADVYNHLTNFFSRYYDDGDFISQRRYKDGVYAIPYEGEEVKLHWANADQYYVKTSEYFKDYTFKTMYGETVHFKLIEAETEMDNNKAKEKRFFQLYTEKPFEVIDGELFVYIEYKASEYSGKTAQARHITDIVEAFAAVQTQPEYLPFAAIMTITDNKTLLERHLNRYTARNTYDYFIHKDLGKFLRRELDFYIKNEVIYLDDIDEQDEAKTKEYLTKAKVIRKIARKIITFLAQIEDFQKKLYLKKKFVVETNYCITLDRVPEAMYPEIAANDAQREEWVHLFTIDEITGDLTQPTYSVPLTVEFLKQNPFLVLDTAFFSTEFKDKLIAGIDNLDENLDGLLINSENFQALNLMEEKYKNKIDAVITDPPYNTGEDDFLYKDNYFHSSWLSMMNDRFQKVFTMMKDGSWCSININDIELFNLWKLLDNMSFSTINNLTVKMSHLSGMKMSHVNKKIPKIKESIIILSKGKDYKLNPIYEPCDWDEAFERYTSFLITSNSDNPADWKREPIRKIALKNGIDTKDLTAYNDFRIKNADKIFRTAVNDSVSNTPKDGVIRKIITASGIEKYVLNGEEILFASQYLKCIDGKLTPVKPQGDIWTDIGINNIHNEGGVQLPNGKKPVKLYERLINLLSNEGGIIMDIFAGSATTAHAVININQLGTINKRKYILAQEGYSYFNNITKKRVENVMFSNEWLLDKPVSRKGTSHAFKYLRLESYEDTLNNIVLSDGNYDLLGAAQEDYMLSYMLNTESAGSASLLNVEKLDKPFSYKMLITRNLESKECNIDLVETFNYLIGLTVIKSHALVSYDADFSTGDYGAVSATLKDGDTYKFKAVEGTVPSGEKTLVIWREMTGDIEKDNATLDAYFLSLPNARSFKRIYVNCDNNLLNLRNKGESWQVVLIDEEMKKRMFENAE
jgi:adenine-specific DNA-methyltransferase